MPELGEVAIIECIHHLVMFAQANPAQFTEWISDNTQDQEFKITEETIVNALFKLHVTIDVWCGIALAPDTPTPSI